MIEPKNEIDLKNIKKVFLSGAMNSSKLPDFNYKQFNDAEDKLKNYFDIVNPAKLSKDIEETTWKGYLALGIKYLVDCDAIIMLPGWDTYKSKGAALEKYIAENLGLSIINYDDLVDYINNNNIETRDVKIVKKYSYEYYKNGCKEIAESTREYINKKLGGYGYTQLRLSLLELIISMRKYDYWCTQCLDNRFVGKGNTLPCPKCREYGIETLTGESEAHDFL